MLKVQVEYKFVQVIEYLNLVGFKQGGQWGGICFLYVVMELF